MNEINVLDLVDEKYLITPVNGKFIKIHYKRKGRGSNPKSFVLPKSVKVDKEFVEAVSMYIGDGKLSEDKAK